MQVLIFALLALAVSADNYHSYYNPYSYGTYGTYGHNYPYYGLGYGSSLYGHNYGTTGLSYALGGHGHYAYQPAKASVYHGGHAIAAPVVSYAHAKPAITTYAAPAPAVSVVSKPVSYAAVAPRYTSVVAEAPRYTSVVAAAPRYTSVVAPKPAIVAPAISYVAPKPAVAVAPAVSYIAPKPAVAVAPAVSYVAPKPAVAVAPAVSYIAPKPAVAVAPAVSYVEHKPAVAVTSGIAASPYSSHGTVQLYGTEPFHSRFETATGPGRISFTLGTPDISGLYGSHDLGAKHGVSSYGKSTSSVVSRIGTVQKQATGILSNKYENTRGPGRISFVLGSSAVTQQSGINSQRPEIFGKLPSPGVQKTQATGSLKESKFEGAAAPGRISFILGSSAASGQSGIHNQGNRPVIPSSGKLPSPVASNRPAHGAQDFNPGFISFTQDQPKPHGPSSDKHVSSFSPSSKLGTSPSFKGNFGHQPFAISAPKITQGGEQAFKDLVSNLDDVFSDEPNFPAFTSILNTGNSAGLTQTFGKSPVFVAVPEESLTNNSPNFKHAYATGSEDKKAGDKLSSYDVLDDGIDDYKSSKHHFSSGENTGEGVSHQNVGSSFFSAPRSPQGVTGGQSSKPPVTEEKSLGLTPSSFSSYEKSPVFVAIPADSLNEESPIPKHFSAVEPINKETGDELYSFDPSFSTSSADDKSSSKYFSMGEVGKRANGSPLINIPSSSPTGAQEYSANKEDIHKYSSNSKLIDSGYKSPIFVAVPEDSLTNDGSFKIGGSHAADEKSVFKFSSTSPAYGTNSQVGSSHRQSSSSYGKSYSYGPVTSPVQSFSSKSYAEYDYVPELSPVYTYVSGNNPAQNSFPIISPFSPLQNYEVIIQKK